MGKNSLSCSSEDGNCVRPGLLTQGLQGETYKSVSQRRKTFRMFGFNIRILLKRVNRFMLAGRRSTKLKHLVIDREVHFFGNCLPQSGKAPRTIRLTAQRFGNKHKQAAVKRFSPLVSCDASQTPPTHTKYWTRFSTTAALPSLCIDFPSCRQR